MKTFNLIPTTSPSEKDFRHSLPGGKEQYQEIIKKVYDSSSDTCPGCGYSTGNKESLQAHLQYWDGVNPDSAEFILVCEGCHSIKHFDQAIEKGWVVLVNSVYSQSELIRRNRSIGIIKQDLRENKIVVLKKTPKEYFEEISNSEVNRTINEKTKILFGNKFVWIK
jgi:hypothetical protein